MHIGKDLAERGLTISAVTLNEKNDGLRHELSYKSKLQISSLENRMIIFWVTFEVWNSLEQLGNGVLFLICIYTESVLLFAE